MSQIEHVLNKEQVKKYEKNVSDADSTDISDMLRHCNFSPIFWTFMNIFFMSLLI